jgi:diguanylate cyclase (GGDEF)-like protein
MINDDKIDCEEWTGDSRHEQSISASYLIAFMYISYAVLNLFMVNEHILRTTDPLRLLSVAFIFIVLALLSYKEFTWFVAYIGLMFVPIGVAIANMLMLKNLDNIPYYIIEIAVLIVWTLVLSGLKFRHAFSSALIVFLITCYSFLIYHAHNDSLPLFYLFLLLVFLLFATMGKHTIEKLLNEVCHKTQKFNELSMTDELTELPRKEKFDFVIKNELERSRRYKYKFGLLMVEIDDFNVIYEKFGKEVRDDLLIVVSTLITDQIRSTDMEIRWGEHEFVVVCLELNLVQLTKIANSILESMRNYDFGRLGRVTLSIGATVNKISDNDISIVNRVKQALLKSKQANGNSVVSL